ncbi:hypothetical protein EYF80_021815 [Liparis tanakae]|uniref:Uncharacterized protein n=1 Tax=Liparis tanakae TaxID=230148 RepID=A0A4Z2HSS6_9TELE|nr:hypothetical protein EYF80_021815 [Liparis tanakae]
MLVPSALRTSSASSLEIWWTRRRASSNRNLMEVMLPASSRAIPVLITLIRAPYAAGFGGAPTAV